MARTPSPPFKTCRTCNETKPIAEFRQRTGRPDHHPYCRICDRQLLQQRSGGFWGERSKALKMRYGETVTPKELEAMLGKPSTCYLCGDEVDLEQATIDHVVPRHNGGKTVNGNLRWTHKKCNAIKHSLAVDEFVELASKIIANLSND